MRLIILFTIGVCSVFNSYAETVEGSANIRTEPNGSLIATIGDGEKLNIRGYRNGWYKVEIPVFIDRNEASDDAQNIPAQTKLYNSKGKVIGTILGNTRIIQGPDSDYERIQGAIVGFTSKANIRPESILESEIEKLLFNKKFALDPDWKIHIKNSGYKPWVSFGDLEGFEIYDEFALDVSPTPRIILFFSKKKLFAIYHSKPIHYAGFKSEDKFLFGHLSYIDVLTGRSKDDLDREFIDILRRAW